ncbi:DUF350 domain-containing protein [candidate division KSB1 bacterium]|nr:DUF350 domain-containing protein [candidate division KSB1 bacterium]
MELIDIYSVLLDLGAGIIYLLACFVLFLVGKFVYRLVNPGIEIDAELVKKDNVAFAVAIAGYYLGLVMAIGGALSGPNNWVLTDPFSLSKNLTIALIHLLDLAIYGVLAIILMNLSILINDKFIMYKFSNRDEIIRDQNAGTGAIEFASYVATGLVVLGAVSGEGGHLVTERMLGKIELGGLISALVFWGLAQVVMVIAGLIYNWMTPYDVHEQIERDNVAAGVGFAGILLAIGNVTRIACSGDFVSWGENLMRFGYIVVIGLLLMPFIRIVVDKILLPGESLSDEIARQEKPNLGAAFIEAVSYVSASFLIGWAI